MRKGKVVAIAAAALVAGLVLGSFGIASAATTATGTVAPKAGMGLRLGGRWTGTTLADIVAKLTGLTVDQVRTDRQSGQSFEQIAKTKDVSADKVVSTALEARKAALDAAVKNGSITQAQADAAYATMKTRITTNVGSTTPGCLGGGAGSGCGAGGCGAGGGGRGMRGAGGCGGACVAAPAAQ